MNSVDLRRVPERLWKYVRALSTPIHMATAVEAMRLQKQGGPEDARGNQLQFLS